MDIHDSKYCFGNLFGVSYIHLRNVSCMFNNGLRVFSTLFFLFVAPWVCLIIKIKRCKGCSTNSLLPYINNISLYVFLYYITLFCADLASQIWVCNIYLHGVDLSMSVESQNQNYFCFTSYSIGATVIYWYRASAIGSSGSVTFIDSVIRYQTC